MVGLLYSTRALDFSPYRRNAGNFVADLGIAFRVCFLNARAFSSLENVEAHKGKNQDGVRLDRVRSLLNGYGFTPQQVTKVFKSSPSTFSRNVETLSPKLAFFRSILGSDDDVARVVTANPTLLASSLKKKLMPNYEFFKSMLDQDKLVSQSIKHSSRILNMDVENNLAAKVSFLIESGVPRTSIVKMMKYSPRVFVMSFVKLEESLKKAISFGFEPSNPMIVLAIKAISQINESVWDRKIEVYRKWGWSNDDFLTAFRKHPFIMCLSEKKINKGMDVFLNKVGLSSLDIVKYPYIMFFSVEERIVPRCSVLALLGSNGILGDNPANVSTYFTALKTSEEAFVERYVDKYPELVLELWLKLRPKAAVSSGLFITETNQ